MSRRKRNWLILFLCLSVWLRIDRPVSAQQFALGSTDGPLRPVVRNTNRIDAPVASPKVSAAISGLFRSVDETDNLPRHRSVLAQSPAVDAVIGIEAISRKSADVGDLLRRSKSAHGISVQNRTPITTDTRVRAQRKGQVLASGSYWAPARQDLDTMMSKIDSRLIDDLIVIKGPYATRYGPGFRFIDLDFIHSPRYENGFENHGMTGLTYKTNGEQWAGRQSVWGGAENWGYHVSYGHQSGSDYETGQDGFFLPTSYNSGDFFGAFGFDLPDDANIELNILQLSQNDLEFPGLVYDLDYLRTEGYEGTYTDETPWIGSQFTAEVWYNRTVFAGDSQGAGKNRQIPQLTTPTILPNGSGFPASFRDGPNGEPGFAETDGDALSGGYRLASTWESNRGHYTIGTDMILLNTELREREAFTNRVEVSVPRSESIDLGLFYEEVFRPNARATVTGGFRVDFMWNDARDDPDAALGRMTQFDEVSIAQQFIMYAGYLTGEYHVTPEWTVDVGFGTSQRPPTLTDMYANFAFIGSLQRGVTSLFGTPALEPERIYQIDLGTKYKTDRWNFGLHTFHAWIEDYLTYELNGQPIEFTGGTEFAAILNTELATFIGGEAYAEFHANNGLVFFGSMNGVEARDRDRFGNSRFSPVGRSFRRSQDETPPGIAPVEARVGVLLQDPTPQKNWGVEFLARIVDNQDRIAFTLGEVATPGFTVYNLRAYWKKNNWLWTGGVENLTDKFYREHIDYRFGRGVFRPGINFYAGVQVQY